MRARSSNPWALYLPPVLLSTGIEYAGERIPHASRKLEEGWRATPSTKLCSSFLTKRGIVPGLQTVGMSRRRAVHDPLVMPQAQASRGATRPGQAGQDAVE